VLTQLNPAGRAAARTPCVVATSGCVSFDDSQRRAVHHQGLAAEPAGVAARVASIPRRWPTSQARHV